MTESLGPLEYMAVKKGRVSRLAVTSLVLGIGGILLAIVLVGFLLGIAAMVVGIIALVRINRRPGELGGRGYAIAGIKTGGSTVLVVMLIVAVLFSWGTPSRESGNRVYCSANLRDMTRACILYASDNSGVFPVLNGDASGATTRYTLDTTQMLSDPPSKKQEEAMYAEYFSGSTGGTGGAADRPGMQIDRTLWILVLKNVIGAKRLICKSDPYADAWPLMLTDSSGQYFVNPVSAGLSYSIAFPWNRGGKGAAAYWRNTGDGSLPLMSDMAKWGSSYPGSSPTDYNSPNHAGVGQNVGYGDVHVEWTRTPLVGQSGAARGPQDNIFTYGTSLRGVQVRAEPVDLSGPPVAPFSTSAPPFDIIMVPSRDGRREMR